MKMINKRTASSQVSAHFHTRLPRRNSENSQSQNKYKLIGKMRLQVASCHWLLLLLLDLIRQGFTADQNKHDIRKTTLSSSNSLMDAMMKKYSYPKNEVTAGVGYGHHLHPFYYQGEKEVMYPCAVECGEWETMDMDDNANDASSNVDVVTVRPDVSTIEITTPKSRPYKDTSFLRPKKYQSSLYSGGQKSASNPSKTLGHNDYNGYQDSKGADVQIIPRKTINGYSGDSADATDVTPNDGTLYAKYHDALVSGYDGELDVENSDNKENEYFDPIEASMGYNSPSFNDADNDDVDAPVYPTKLNSHPERGRIEEKYVKHNVREERLEDVRTNSFGPSGDEENYPTSSSGATGKQPSSYNPPKYIDDYAAPISKPYTSYPPNQDHRAADNGRPFRPSTPQSKIIRPQKLHQFYKKPRNNIPHQDYGGYSDYQAEDYGVEGDDYNENPVKYSYYGPPKSMHYEKNNQQGRIPALRIRRPSIYGRNQKYRPIHDVDDRHRAPYSQSDNLSYPPKFRGKPYYGSHPRSLYSENGKSYPYRSYAPSHGYSPQNQRYPQRSNSGGIRVVSPPRIRQEKFPYSKRGVRTNPHTRGQRLSYRRSIPHKNGFTKIVKNYRSFVDHTPKRFVGSGEYYGAP